MSGFAKARQIAEQALDLPPEQRALFLAERCGDDEELLVAARELVGPSDESLPGLLDFAATDPTRIGPYTILRRLAVGGMGVVYEAEQGQPRRTVAVKTMRQGVESTLLLRRFKVELEALAGLQHPAIAQVYEGGTFQSLGPHPVPYFAMELIEDARDILTFCRERRLTLRERLELFITVCSAVQYGHDRGVIHRDLKPGNILVDVQGHPKLIDYGVAQVRDLEPHLQTTIEEQGLIVGTLSYLPPEALDGGAADVSGDVYALGVCLFELLAGERPTDLSGVSPAVAADRLRREEPRGLRQVDPSLPRELEWIVACALERDPGRRFLAVRDLGEDLRRFLAGEAVSAGAPSWHYRLRKSIERHRLLTATGVVTFLASVAVFVVIARALETERGLRAEADLGRQEAEEEARRTSAAVAFVLELFHRMNPEEDGPDARAMDLLEAGSEAVAHSFGGRPDLQVEVRRGLAQAFVHAELYEQALEQLELALADAEGIVEGGGREEALVLRDLVTLQVLRRNIPRARALGARCMEVTLRAFGPGSRDLVLAQLRRAQGDYHGGDYAAAVQATEGPLATLVEVDGWESRTVREFALGFVVMLVKADRMDEARTWSQRALLAVAEHEGAVSKQAIQVREALAHTWSRAERFDEALAQHRRSLELRIELYGEENRSVAVAKSNIASALMNLDRDAEAEQILLEITRDFRDQPATEAILAAHNNLGWLLLRADRFEEAREQFQAFVDRASEWTEPPWNIATALKGLAQSHALLDETEAAERAFLSAYQTLLERFGEQDERTRGMAGSIADFYEFCEQPADAARWYPRSGQ